MNKKHLIIIMLLTLLPRLFFAFTWHEIWWDSGVYIGMGKYLYSGGTAGLWEHIRPPVVPLILGFFWKLGLDPALFGRLFEILCAVGISIFTYLLAREWFTERIALLSALIVTFSPILFYLSFHQYTELPSLFFALFGIYIFLKNRLLFSGLLLGLAFLTKFPVGIYFGIILVYLLFQRRFIETVWIVLGFSIVSAPYFIATWLIYGTPLATFLAAQEAIRLAVGCNVLRAQPFWQYFVWLFTETPLYLFGLIGIFTLRKKPLYTLFLIIPLIYYMQLHCRDYRYLATMLPFFAILAASGIIFAFDYLVRTFKRKQQTLALVLLCIVISALMAHTMLRFYFGNEPQQPNPLAEDYFSYLSRTHHADDIWISNPVVAAYTDLQLQKIYYPIYNEGLSLTFHDYLRTTNVSLILLDNCGGGIICDPSDSRCLAQTERLMTHIETNYIKIYDEQHGRCWYRIFTSR